MIEARQGQMTISRNQEAACRDSERTHVTQHPEMLERRQELERAPERVRLVRSQTALILVVNLGSDCRQKG